MMIVENDLVVNKVPLREIGLQGHNFIKRLKRKGITRVDFLKGITLSELKALHLEHGNGGRRVETKPAYPLRCR